MTEFKCVECLLLFYRASSQRLNIEKGKGRRDVQLNVHYYIVLALEFYVQRTLIDYTRMFIVCHESIKFKKKKNRPKSQRI